MLIFMLSAVLSPITVLYLRFTYCTIALSKLAPAVRIECDSTIPPSDTTAASHIPAPMFTTMHPTGAPISAPHPAAAASGASISAASRIPAPCAASSAARRSTSLIPHGTDITARTLENDAVATCFIKYLSIATVALYAVIAPPRIGIIADTPSGVLPIISLAAEPIATTWSLVLLFITSDGSFNNTSPFSSQIKVVDVPKSIPKSTAIFILQTKSGPCPT